MRGYWILCGVIMAVVAPVLPGCGVPQVHTQLFLGDASDPVDLQNTQLYFIPTPGENFYQRRVIGINDLANDPAGDERVDFSDGPVEVPLGENAVHFYGDLYDAIVIGPNGTVGMGEMGDNSDLTAHFSRPQVSLLPVTAFDESSSVSYEIVNRFSVTVTYEDVIAGSAPATAQVEFFIDDLMYGHLAMSYTDIATDAAGIYGLSRGYRASEIDEILDDFNLQIPLTTEVMTGSLSGR